MIETSLIVTSIIAYLIGSIPSGYLIARLNGIADIREHGSGNIGATNVARILGLKYFFIVFFADFFKAAVLLGLLQWCNYSIEHLVCAALFLLLGNALPIFLQLRGGKGVATTLGVLFVLQPLLLLYAFAVWVVTFCMSQTVGIASVATLLTLPFLTVFIVQELSWLGLFIFFISLWGIFLHRTNIKNFAAGR